METTVTNGASVKIGNHVIVNTDTVRRRSVKRAGSSLRVTIGVSKNEENVANKRKV